jgi:hypothetical protein
VREVGEAGERVEAGVNVGHDGASKTKRGNRGELERVAWGGSRKRRRGGRGGNTGALLWVLAEVEKKVECALLWKLLLLLLGSNSLVVVRRFARPGWDAFVIICRVTVIIITLCAGLEIWLTDAKSHALVLVGTLIRLAAKGHREKRRHRG